MDELNDTMDMSLEDPSIHEVNRSPALLTYQLMEETSKRKRELLVDSNGYRYAVKRRLKSTVHWHCTVRPKVNLCGATVVQTPASESFRPGPKAHNHSSDPGAAVVEKIKKRVIETATKEVFKSASVIVNEVSILVERDSG